MNQKNDVHTDPAKRFVTSYSRGKYDTTARYIHKYYLPLEVKQRIFLADIRALKRARVIEDAWRGNPSDPPPCCVVYYDDLCLEKAIPAHDVALVLQAITAYYDDCRCKLTDDENRAAMNLNTWLRDWEKTFLAECVRISEEMEQRVRSGDSWLTDYEIDLEVEFYIRDDDPFSEENNPDAYNHDVDEDASLLCSMKFSFMVGPIFAKEVESPDYWGIGDGKDHNYEHGPGLRRKSLIYEVEQCCIFHELYSDIDIPMKHMGRIGYVATEIKVRHQNGISINVAGEKTIADQDEPRIREHFSE